MAKSKFLLIILSLALFGFSCNNDSEKDDSTKIKTAIESSLFEDMNNPDSYEFNQIRFLDTLYVRDVYLNEIKSLNDELENKNILRRSYERAKKQEISRRLNSLREEFRVYGMYDQFDRFKNVLSLFEQDNALWIDRLNDLETEIRKSDVQEYRYRNELPIFEQIRAIKKEIDIVTDSNERIDSIESDLQEIEQYIESNEERMNEIAFYRILFSHREENLFGGLQLIRKVHEVRFKNELVDLMWQSENFEANEEVLQAIKNLSYGKGMEIVKQENELL